MDYIKKLKNHNLKVTSQRLEIINIILKNGHINIANLYKALKIKFPTLSLATIYKNINAMCDTLFLSEVRLPNQKNVYELIKQEHSHAVCLKCNKIMDIDLDTSSILNQAKQVSDYSLYESSIIFSGICPDCLD